MVPANIAEGSKRRHAPDFARFLNLAEPSLAEAEYFVLLSQDLGYVPQAPAQPLFSEFEELSSRALGRSTLRKALVREVEHRLDLVAAFPGCVLAGSRNLCNDADREHVVGGPNEGHRSRCAQVGQHPVLSGNVGADQASPVVDAQRGRSGPGGLPLAVHLEHSVHDPGIAVGDLTGGCSAGSGRGGDRGRAILRPPPATTRRESSSGRPCS
ncbi:MAG: four helix bundle protein [Armatimonadetes bacterium]|nr:four helix bundle protein [Armatimonadota bacterium]